MGYRDSNQAVPDPGTSNGAADPLVYRCADCAWVERHGTTGAGLLAAKHHQVEGHRVTWRGIVRDFSRVPEEA